MPATRMMRTRIPSRPPRRPSLSALGALAFALGALSCGGDALDPDRPPVASVVVVPNRLSVGVGASATLTAEARDAAGALLRGRKIAWATQDPAVATVSSAGVVTGVRAGEVQVAATSEGKSAIVAVTVTPKAVASIRLTPAGDVRLFVSETKQMAAEPLASDGSVLADRALTWSSNSPSVASVSTTGLITAVAPGGAVITAASEGKTAVVAVTVSAVPVASVAVSPASDVVVVSQTLQLSAVPRDAQGTALTGRAVSWTSSDATRATVSSTGMVTGVAPGAVTITATSEGKVGTASITVQAKPVSAVIVSPSQVSLEPGQTRQLTAQVTDDQGNVLSGRPISYSSDNAAVATVSASGLVTGVAPGTAKVTATSEGKSGTADVTVTAVPVASVDVAPAQSSLTVGQTVTLVATARDAKGNVLQGRGTAWTSGSTSIATVSSAGVVTAVGPGDVFIFAAIEGKFGSAVVNVRQPPPPPGPVDKITVSPATATMTANQTQTLQLTATLTDANGTVLTGRQITWSSSNLLRATVDQTGRVTARASKGTVTITATSEGKSGISTITIQ